MTTDEAIAYFGDRKQMARRSASGCTAPIAGATIRLNCGSLRLNA
jgi:hypothetical protein